MKTRIKIFSSDATGNLESKVNEWIAGMEEKDGFEIINTMQSGKVCNSFDRISGTTVFTIVYKIAVDQEE
ncbi:MAG: hypothetical protein NC131_13550 [Roseburia sp.]|nr:hypothetical protein [Roseburia sp.]